MSPLFDVTMLERCTERDPCCFGTLMQSFPTPSDRGTPPGAACGALLTVSKDRPKRNKQEQSLKKERKKECMDPLKEITEK